MIREEAQIGDYGKLDYRAEHWEPEIFKKVWHHNGIVKAVWKTDGKEMLAVHFMNYCNPDECIVVPSYCFDNFTRQYGTTAPEENTNYEDCDKDVLRVIREQEAAFFGQT